MTSEEKWEFITKLDEELLLGGVILSEWSSFLIRDADEAFCAGAHLAAILAAQAAMECHLRHEYSSGGTQAKLGFFNLIESAPLPDDLRADLHTVRRYRNRWVHVHDPGSDDDLLQRPEYYDEELERMASIAIRAMRRVIYLEQFV
jgi:hypothetical protein